MYVYINGKAYPFMNNGRKENKSRDLYKISGYIPAQNSLISSLLDSYKNLSNC